jgi:iron complex transport system substrate-binding protein
MTLLVIVTALASSPLWLGPKPVAPEQMARVVTLAPSLSEMLEEMGAGELLVGVSRFDESPRAASLPKVGGFNDVSIETVLSVKPQLVVAQKSPGNRRAIEQLAKLGIPILALALESVDDVTEGMRALGKAIGSDAEGDLLAFQLESARRVAREHAAARSSTFTAMIVYGFRPLVVAGPKSFAHELLNDCGVSNVAQASATAYPSYSVEKAVAMAPQVAVDLSDSADGRAQVVELLGPRTRWVTMPSKGLMHPGPALVQGLRELDALFMQLSTEVRH